MKSYHILGIRNRTLMESYGLLESYCRPVPGMDAEIKKAMEVGIGLTARTCYNIEDRKEVRKTMEREIRDGKYTQEFFDAVDKAYKDVVRTIKAHYSENLSLLPNKKLIEYFNTYYQIYITTLHPMVLAIYASDLQDLFEAELRKLLTEDERTQEKVIEYTALLLTPTRLTTVQKEEEMLFALQRDFERHFPSRGAGEFGKFLEEPRTQKKLEEFSRLYGWFHMEYVGEQRTPQEYGEQLRERVEDLKKAGSALKRLSSPSDRLEETVRRQKEFFTSHQHPNFFRDLVFAMQEFLIVLDFSKADLVEGIFYARPLLTEIASRIGAGSWIDVRFLLPEEIKGHLKDEKRIDPARLEERKKHFTFVLERRKIASYYGDGAAQKAEELLEKVVVKDAKEFRGQTAYPGKVRGTACVITGAEQKNKFIPGSILVTRETTTELTSIIRSSIAIVADQGSLLSHTAIVSREFKIPCLVLTKIGTSVVKDGDKLEVDASKGIFKILD